MRLHPLQAAEPPQFASQDVQQRRASSHVAVSHRTKMTFHDKNYGAKSKEEVGKAMHEFKEGKLKSGKSGKKVSNPKQAIAIGLSKARKEGGKVPARKS